MSGPGPITTQSATAPPAPATTLPPAASTPRTKPGGGSGAPVVHLPSVDKWTDIDVAAAKAADALRWPDGSAWVMEPKAYLKADQAGAELGCAIAAKFSTGDISSNEISERSNLAEGPVRYLILGYRTEDVTACNASEASAAQTEQRWAILDRAAEHADEAGRMLKKASAALDQVRDGHDFSPTQLEVQDRFARSSMLYLQAIGDLKQAIVVSQFRLQEFRDHIATLHPATATVVKHALKIGAFRDEY
jgi:hypothetical protein